MNFRKLSLLDLGTVIVAVIAVAAIVRASATVIATMRVVQRAQAAALVRNDGAFEGELAVDRATDHGSQLVLVEFSDFQCPFCGQYARDTFGRIKKELVDRGAVDYMFRNFPLSGHAFAARAAEAAECAGDQGKYWEMHDALFANQTLLSEAWVSAQAEPIGLDRHAFARCLAAGENATRVAADREEGARLGIRATPTFLLAVRQDNGRAHIIRRFEGAQSYENFKAVIRLESERLAK